MGEGVRICVVLLTIRPRGTPAVAQRGGTGRDGAGGEGRWGVHRRVGEADGQHREHHRHRAGRRRPGGEGCTQWAGSFFTAHPPPATDSQVVWNGPGNESIGLPIKNLLPLFLVNADGENSHEHNSFVPFPKRGKKKEKNVNIH